MKSPKLKMTSGNHQDRSYIPHHDINHDANINEEKQSYYQDSLFFFG